MVVVAALLSSCNSDNIEGETYYTFKGETITSYCKNRSDLSIFSKLMEDSDTDKLLSCYGHYTGFIPTDSAFQVYFEEKQITYDSLTTEDKKAIVYDHIISDKRTNYTTDNFEEGALPVYNMSNNSLTISYANFDKGSRAIYVNKTSLILQKDIKVHNGVIHSVNMVIEPSVEFLLDIMKNESYFTIFSEAFELTHMDDSTHWVFDINYVCPLSSTVTNIDGTVCAFPKYKKYGYTIFAETDKVFQDAGITTISDLAAFAEQYYGTEDPDDYTSRNNALNKFISYHVLNRSMSTNSLLYGGECTAPDYKNQQFEYYETLLKYRLIEVKSGNNMNTRKDGSHVAIDEFSSNLQGINGYVHTLKNILVYDEDVMQNDVLNKRIRFNAISVPPQLTTNNFRWTTNYTNAPALTLDYCDEYLKFNFHSGCEYYNIAGSPSWHHYQGETMVFQGWYDYSLRLLPVPPGTYEIRYGHVTDGNDPISQLYIDDKIIGIPIDMSHNGTDPIVGWVADSETDDDGIENDKMMRNLGYMKGLSSVLCENGTSVQRQHPFCIRKILGTFTFQEYSYHTYRVKNVENGGGSMGLDYIEYVPTSYLAKEGRE